jgi:hypothetical protein
MTIQPWETDPAAVAYEFMTAGGLNTPEQITDLIGDRSVSDAAASFADEAAENWTLHVDFTELQDAIAEFISTRPDTEIDA